MSDTLKVLAQSAPTASSITDIYTVPGATSTTISSIMVCNQNSTGSINFRISIAVSGASDTPKQYLYYDVPLISNDTFVAVIGLTLGSSDVLRVMTDTANVSFSVFGVEVS